MCKAFQARSNALNIKNKAFSWTYDELPREVDSRGHVVLIFQNFDSCKNKRKNKFQMLPQSKSWLH